MAEVKVERRKKVVVAKIRVSMVKAPVGVGPGGKGLEGWGSNGSWPPGLLALAVSEINITQIKAVKV